MRNKQDPFVAIDSAELMRVAGGASRITARSSGSTDQMAMMLQQVQSSIQALGSQNQSGGGDMMSMMMMMMMMGGGGGGGGGAPPPAPAAPPPLPTLNISVRNRGGYY